MPNKKQFEMPPQPLLLDASNVALNQLADLVADRVAARLSDRSSEDALIDVHQAAALLNCSVPTVERLTKSGAIPSHKVGRLRRYRRAELLARMDTGAAR
jgi:excisionase family DNA binding protein